MKELTVTIDPGEQAAQLNHLDRNGHGTASRHFGPVIVKLPGQTHADVLISNPQRPPQC